MKILVADDSKTMRYVLINQLKELGYDTIVEADCVDKAKSLCLSTDPPTLIISDWNMPGASGLDFLKFIRGNASTSKIPFIILTTEMDRVKIIEATKAGVQSYLLKPIRKTILIEKMRELAAAYEFTPPREASPANHTMVAVAQEEEHPLKGKVKKEQIAKILEEYGRIWKNESNAISFEEFIAKEIFGGSLEEKADDVAFFMVTIQTVAQDAIDRKLNQLV